MAACSQLYKKSTLPPLLDSYLPVHYRNQNGINQEKTETDNKKPTRHNKHVLSDEEKDEIIKQALEEQHYLETFKNLYRLRNVLRERYKTLLNEKVQKQQIQTKMSNFRVQQHIKHKEKKIVGLQNELTKLGILKNQEDYEKFWELTQEAVRESKLKEMLPDIKAKMCASKLLTLSTSARTNPVKHCNGFTNINTLKKSMTAPLLQSAGTCELPSHHMSKQMTTQTQTKEMFPKSKTCKRNRRYEQHLHYLHHMHYVSLVNMVSSKRMLEKNGQFSDVRTEQSAHDLMEYLFPNQHEQSGMNHNIQIMEEDTFPSLIGSKQNEKHHKLSSKRFKGSKEKKRTMKQHKNNDVGERGKDQKCNITIFAQQETITVPLTLEDAALYHPVVEVKARGTHWKNYTDKDSINNGKNINYKWS